MSRSVPVSARVAAAVVLAAALALGGCSSEVAGSASPVAGGGAGAPAAGPEPSGAPQPTSAAPTPGGGGQARQGDAFDDAQGRFDLLPPEGWDVDTSGQQGTTAVFLDPQPVSTAAGQFRVNVNVIVGAFDGDLDDLLAETRTQLTTFTAYTSTADEDVELSDGTKAHLIGGTFTDDASGFDLQNLQLFTVDGGNVFAVTGTAPVEVWDDYEAELESTLRSLTLSV
ncbi:hypothetical protein [Pseudonocardia humida]|uniref:Lipoprotein LpqN n=1 Tax=Pseudonocardia humida TaxID=2800819 RepID=A0ABT1A1K0_9PSEU|nr:hypothetical protein [Pseudonocardia humida]MCO1656795.1 hypothetical protein [Pseudonocardia humida]